MQIRLFYKFSLILFFICVGVTAQDTQYWNKQYGTYGELLGGTVVGGVSDLSSTYYNPGAMAFAKDTTLILSTSSIQFIFIDRKDVGGTNIDLESSSVLSSPSFFALRIPLKGLGNNQLAASYITRYSFRYVQLTCMTTYSRVVYAYCIYRLGVYLENRLYLEILENIFHK